MFRLTFAIASVTALVAAVLVVACGEDEPAASKTYSTTDAAPASPGLVDARTAEPDSAGEKTMSTMRLAHLAPGIGALDFCYHGAGVGTFIGPVLAPPVDAGDAGDAGVLPSATYRTVSRYLNVEASGPVTIAIVQAGATSCAGPLLTADVTLDPGKLSTVAIFSRIVDAGPQIELASFTDDRTTIADKVRVRVIHAALGTKDSPPRGAIGVRVVGARSTVLTDRVEPRKAGPASEAVGVDALGYLTAPPTPSPAAIAIGPAQTDASFEPWKSAEADLELRGDSLHTAFVLSGEPFEVIWCADTTTADDQTSCKRV